VQDLTAGRASWQAGARPAVATSRWTPARVRPLSLRVIVPIEAAALPEEVRFLHAAGERLAEIRSNAESRWWKPPTGEPPE